MAFCGELNRVQPTLLNLPPPNALVAAGARHRQFASHVCYIAIRSVAEFSPEFPFGLSLPQLSERESIVGKARDCGRPY